MTLSDWEAMERPLADAMHRADWPSEAAFLSAARAALYDARRVAAGKLERPTAPRLLERARALQGLEHQITVALTIVRFGEHDLAQAALGNLVDILRRAEQQGHCGHWRVIGDGAECCVTLRPTGLPGEFRIKPDVQVGPPHPEADPYAVLAAMVAANAAASRREGADR